jgi:hypothetical protein
MNTKVTTLAALVASVLVSNVHEVAAQTSPPPSTATRQATTTPAQTSVPTPARRPRQPRRLAKQPRSDGQENEGRKAESRYQGQIASKLPGQVSD